VLSHDLVHALLAPLDLRAQLVNHFALFLGFRKQAFVCLLGLLFGMFKFVGTVASSCFKVAVFD